MLRQEWMFLRGSISPMLLQFFSSLLLIILMSRICCIGWSFLKWTAIVPSFLPIHTKCILPLIDRPIPKKRTKTYFGEHAHQRTGINNRIDAGRTRKTPWGKSYSIVFVEGSLRSYARFLSTLDTTNRQTYVLWCEYKSRVNHFSNISNSATGLLLANKIIFPLVAQ